MSYLDCSEQDCCHNKAGSCCLGGISVHHAGHNDAVCRSYRNNEAYGNVATDNAPANPETQIRCDDTGCCYNDGKACQANHVTVQEQGCGPRCTTRTQEQK